MTTLPVSTMSREFHQRIIGLLDDASAINLALTSRSLYEEVGRSRRFGSLFKLTTGLSTTTATTATTATNTVTWALTSFPFTTGTDTWPPPTFSLSASHSSSVAADDDTLASTDTDAVSSPEEHVWEFQITPEIAHRLSLLPLDQSTASIKGIPTEIKLQIFSHLDLIDSTCLGLSSPSLYVVHRAIHGTKIPLNTRRVGPNLLESAWEVVGKQECKQCKMYRCELHEHIKTWMPKDLEYCSMKRNFGLRAEESSTHQFCYRGKPSKPHRCGRHPLRTTSVHQDDSSFSLPR